MIVNGLICEGPKCNKGKDNQRVSISWSADEVRANPELMPDSFFRFSSWQANYEEPSKARGESPTVHQFCSPQCTVDFLRHVVPPLSPREQAAIAKNNQEVDDKKEPATDEGVPSGGNA